MKKTIFGAFAILGLALGLALIAQSPSYGDESIATPASTPAVSPNSSALRDQLAEMLQSNFASTPQGQEQAAGVLQSYRLNTVLNAPTIAGAPFVGYVFQNEILPNYAATYDSQYAAAYKDNVTDLTLEGLYDLFMGEIISGGLTGDLAKTGNEIGLCLAKKIKRGKSDSCTLDSSDREEKAPSKLELGLMKYTCGVGLLDDLESPCNVRKAVFADAKPMLIKAQKEGVIAKAFVTEYPTIFRKTLIDGVNQDQARIAQLVSSKFQSTYNPKIWNAPLVDLDNSNGQGTLHAFAEGLRVDMRAASLFAGSDNPQLKAMSGPLFYAAANRLLVLMGGTQSKWDGTKFVEATQDPNDAFDPNNPKKAPVFSTARFGGITATMLAGHEVSSTLNIANYSPDPGPSVTPLQIFPSTFVLGANAVPSLQGNTPGSVETLGDLADLMSALTDFMELSTPSSALAPHFISGADITRIVDKDDPALFPRQGRELAAGLIAAELQNMLSPQGHLELPAAMTVPTSAPVDPVHTGAFGIKFYDQVSLQGRIPGKVPTDSLARLFFEAARFSDLMATNDPGIPAALIALRSDLDEGVQIWLLSALSAQNTDGGMSEYFGEKQTAGRALETQLDVLRSLTIGYKAGASGVVRQCIHDLWVYLDRYVLANGQWIATEPNGGAIQMASKQALWSALNLWDHTVGSPIYKDMMDPANDPAWANSHGWDRWQRRFDALRAQLQSQ